MACVGTIAAQIARSYGVEFFISCDPAGVSFMRIMGLRGRYRICVESLLTALNIIPIRDCVSLEIGCLETSWAECNSLLERLVRSDDMKRPVVQTIITCELKTRSERNPTTMPASHVAVAHLQAGSPN